MSEQEAIRFADKDFVPSGERVGLRVDKMYPDDVGVIVGYNADWGMWLVKLDDPTRTYIAITEQVAKDAT